MHLSEIVHPDMVWASLSSKDKTQVILELAQNISKKHPSISSDDIATALLNREKLGSTGVQDGVAIPHAKMLGLEETIIACGRSLEGIDFDSPDQKPTHLFFVLLASERSAAMHLKILARLSRLLKDKEFRDKLLTLKSANEMYQTIIDEDARH